ncbi:MAG: helix-turn-helix domain-containing protein [Pyrinomonadaceae bacterium]
MERQILIADEVAELLRVDRQRVYELARRNAIPVIRLGERQYRFDAEAIRQWMKRGGSSAILACDASLDSGNHGDA